MVQDFLDVFVLSSEELNADYAMAAELLFNHQKNEGILVDEESARRDVEDKHGFPTVALNKEYFAKGPDGMSRVEKIIIGYVDFFISQGILTEQDKQEMLSKPFVDSTFVDNLK